MFEIGIKMAKFKYTLRSGGAEGADTAFEKGADLGGGKKEIFLPWPRFNNHPSELCNPDPVTYEYVKLHPKYAYLSRGAIKLHARNVHQILGKDLRTKSKIVICYTDENRKSGGTKQALRIANNFKIPIFNLRKKEHRNEIINRLGIKV